jgi:hypothetical protein
VNHRVDARTTRASIITSRESGRDHRKRVESTVLTNLKVSKLMAKYGPKTLYISTGGGNMPKEMMNGFIIEMQRYVDEMQCIQSLSSNSCEK